MYAVTHENKGIICIFPEEESAREWIMQRAARAALESFRDFRAAWLICPAFDAAAGAAVGGEIGRVTAERRGRKLTVSME